MEANCGRIWGFRSRDMNCPLRWRSGKAGGRWAGLASPSGCVCSTESIVVVFWDVCCLHSDREGCWDLGCVPVGSGLLDDMWSAVGVIQQPLRTAGDEVRWGWVDSSRVSDKLADSRTAYTGAICALSLLPGWAEPESTQASWH